MAGLVSPAVWNKTVSLWEQGEELENQMEKKSQKRWWPCERNRRMEEWGGEQL